LVVPIHRRYGIHILLLLLAATHYYVISHPSDTTVFDEFYYVPASKDLLNLTASNIEHPFFGKLWGAMGILLLGDNFLGWRLFYVLIGLASVFAFYRLAQNFMSVELSLLASSLLGFENIFFMHTSLLLLDGPCILFALLSFTSYLRKRYYLSALLIGLSVLSKEWGVYFAFALLLFHLYTHRGQVLSFRSSGWGKLATCIFIAVLTFSAPIWLYDYVYQPYSYMPIVARPAYTQVVGLTGITVGPYSTVTVRINASLPTTNTTSLRTYRFNITNPLQNWQFYITYQSSLTGCSSGDWNCYPWLWILPYGNIYPLPYYVSYSQSDPDFASIAWLGIGNLVLWYSIWPVLLVIAVRAFRKHFTSLDAFILSLLAGTYLPLFVLALVFQRVLYAFYMINVDLALALGVPLLISYIARGDDREMRLLSILWLIDALAFFALFFPVRFTSILYRGPFPSSLLLAPVMLLFVSLFAYASSRAVGSGRPLLISVICLFLTLASLALFLTVPGSLSAFSSHPLWLSSFLVMVGEFFTALLVASTIAYQVLRTSFFSRANERASQGSIPR
jgi:hypothetical protein